MRAESIQLAEENLPAHAQRIAEADQFRHHQQLMIIGRKNSIDGHRADLTGQRIGVVGAARDNAVGGLHQLNAIRESRQGIKRGLDVRIGHGGVQLRRPARRNSGRQSIVAGAEQSALLDRRDRRKLGSGIKVALKRVGDTASPAAGAQPAGNRRLPLAGLIGLLLGRRRERCIARFVVLVTVAVRFWGWLEPGALLAARS